ncbi:MAG: hypothetical protein HY939_06140 [Gammaproteobacteria bacterium]|nr:hypothetical protein [Gammaproteobacteria bacterium]
MGIGTAPLKESYSELIKNPPDKSPLFSVYVDEKNKWINHHAVVAHYWFELPNEKTSNIDEPNEQDACCEH